MRRTLNPLALLAVLSFLLSPGCEADLPPEDGLAAGSGGLAESAGASGVRAGSSGSGGLVASGAGSSGLGESSAGQQGATAGAAPAEGGSTSTAGATTGGTHSVGGEVDAGTSGSSAGGTSAAGGASGATAASGGTSGRGSNSAGGSAGAGGTTGSCENLPVDETPFGCELAWGANGDSGTRKEYLDFITTWVGDEPNGGLDGDCGDCELVRSVAATGARIGYYAYFIGFQANLQGGFGDCNVNEDAQTLCTRGAEWLKAHRADVIAMYANYARMTYQADPSKGVLWLLEGDFIQYTRDSQSSPLTLAQAGQLTADITCAIKSNAPNALVAMDHSTWNSNEDTDAFWGAMPLTIMDFVWTTGAGNADGYFDGSTDAGSYNARTAQYSYLHALTGKRILVDTSFGASQQTDSWSDQSASTLNQRIAEGVFAINVTSPPSDSTYAGRIDALGNLASICD